MTDSKQNNEFVITTAIDYANGEPHIGHVYEKILGDAIARYQRLAGRDVTFVMGTDEHGEKISKAAAKAGVTPQELVDDLSDRAFRGLWDRLEISYDAFIRTTAQRHKKFVQDVLQRVYDAGDIYFAEYEGLYSVGAERYVTDKELVEGTDGVRRYPGDRDAPELRREANYFFRMEKYQDWLLDTLKANPGADPARRIPQRGTGNALGADWPPQHQPPEKPGPLGHRTAVGRRSRHLRVV